MERFEREMHCQKPGGASASVLESREGNLARSVPVESKDCFQGVQAGRSRPFTNTGESARS